MSIVFVPQIIPVGGAGGSDQPPKVFVWALCILMPLLVVASIFAIDDIGFKGKYEARIFLKKSCGYQIPAGYKLVYDSTEKEYAIAATETYGGFERMLRYSVLEIKMRYTSMYAPTPFTDSCQAKRALEKYIIQETPKANRFK